MFSKHPGATPKLWARAQGGVLLNAGELASMMHLSRTRGRKIVLEMARLGIIPSIRVNRRVILFDWLEIRRNLLEKYLDPNGGMVMRGIEQWGEVPDSVLLEGAIRRYDLLKEHQS